ASLAAVQPEWRRTDMQSGQPARFGPHYRTDAEGGDENKKQPANCRADGPAWSIDFGVGALGDPATVINASGLSDNFEQWFVLTNDLLLNPTFPGDELNRLKQRVKTQL